MNKIRENRRKLGLTQVELANQLNLSQGALSGYETGRYDPDMATMQRMAEYFHVSLDELFGSGDKQSPEIGDIDFALSGEIRDLTATYIIVVLHVLSCAIMYIIYEIAANCCTWLHMRNRVKQGYSPAGWRGCCHTCNRLMMLS